ncbi:chaperone protein dnaK [Dothidotthia symphoricarpi CBS 119687]|uniref:Chaperone protein dnaK n=1 Tax=Dothidotthia symphoricarpi CBS 119687 TaxID=1392245 RepID=A0A6A6AN96_9PLEO|nr:chaperone protein dnaK [Dothidotthia symphoricarpi CBS 119687]KAF2131961.1 chaperone protein dnaK [Dothidotthia symphoricarpi CBS 119687]
MSAPADPTQRVAIGIAFGNSYSSIAYTTGDGKAEVIANEDGDRYIPSLLSYVDGEELHGGQAKGQLVRNPQNTAAYFRDFLGQEFSAIDPSPCHQSAHPVQHESGVAFSIRDTEDETPSTVTVDEATTRHLKRLRASASDYLGKDVNAAVMTVPTNFSDAQKEALRAAAKNANIEVLQFINEPTAAVLAYDARPGAQQADKIVVVADLGGTRSDISVLASRGGIYTMLATVHDYEVSGSKLDQVLMDHFAKEFIKKHKSAGDPREDARSLAKLRLECEAVKKALSIGTTANFSVESLIGGIDYTATINRTRYDLLGNKLFSAFTRLVTQAVEKADLDPLDISEIILAGGNSHTPKVASAVRSAFPDSTTVLAPSTSPTAINPSELPVRGAAIQASLIQEFELEDIEQSTHPMVTVTPHLTTAIGVLCISGDESSGVFHAIIDAETPLPVRRTATISTPQKGGDVLIKLTEGSRHIKVTKPEPKPKSDAKDDDDSDEDDSEDEAEELREKTWKVGKTLSEAAIRDVKKGGKVEVQINVGVDLSINAIFREVGAKGGVRGLVQGQKAQQNGGS